MNEGIRLTQEVAPGAKLRPGWEFLEDKCQLSMRKDVLIELISNQTTPRKRAKSICSGETVGSVVGPIRKSDEKLLDLFLSR